MKKANRKLELGQDPFMIRAHFQEQKPFKCLHDLDLLVGKLIRGTAG